MKPNTNVIKRKVMPLNSKIATRKLCRRSNHLQNGTVPTPSSIRQELGSSLANVILECLSPACQEWMGIDRKLRGPSEYCLDQDQLKSNIHEHILKIGRTLEDRKNRKPSRTCEKKFMDDEEIEFVKFECRQKIEIARAEERRKLELRLQDAKMEMQKKYNDLKRVLYESKHQERCEMANYMCRNLRKQARELMKKITGRFKKDVEEEVALRTDRAVIGIKHNLGEIVHAAVEKQKAVDKDEMQKMSYRYEALLRNVEHRAICRSATTFAQKICSQWSESSKQSERADRYCQASLIVPTIDENADSIDDSEGFVKPSSWIETNDVFVIETCCMEPGPSPVQSLVSSDTEYESVDSSSTLQAFTLEGRVYAKPEYYRKIHEKLFPIPTFTWKPIELDDPWAAENLVPIDSSFTRTVVDEIIACPDFCQKEEVLGRQDLEEKSSNEIINTIPAESSFTELFDLEKSESVIEILANGISLKYIRATENDFN